MDREPSDSFVVFKVTRYKREVVFKCSSTDKDVEVTDHLPTPPQIAAYPRKSFRDARRHRQNGHSYEKLGKSSLLSDGVSPIVNAIEDFTIRDRTERESSRLERLEQRNGIRLSVEVIRDTVAVDKIAHKSTRGLDDLRSA